MEKIIIEKVTESVLKTGYENKLFANVNASAIILSNFVIFVDSTLYPKHSKLFREQIEEKYGLPTKYVLLTHYHGDHVLGLKSFKDINIVGSSKMIPLIKYRKVNQWSDQELKKWSESEPENSELIDQIEIIDPNITFENRLIFYDDKVQVEYFHSGGHTICSSYVFIPKEKIIISGDLLFDGDFPYGGDETCNPDKWIETLNHFLTLDFEIAIPGHGKIMNKNQVKGHLNNLEKIKDVVKSAIKDNLDPSEIDKSGFQYTEEWVITSTFEHWYKYYSNRVNKRKQSS